MAVFDVGGRILNDIKEKEIRGLPGRGPVAGLAVALPFHGDDIGRRGLVSDAPRVPGGYLIIDGLGEDMKTTGRGDPPAGHGVHGRDPFGVVSVDKVSRGRGERPFVLLHYFPRHPLAHGVHDGGSVGVPPIDQSSRDIGPVAQPPLPWEGIDGIESEGNLKGGIRDVMESGDEIIPIIRRIAVAVRQAGVVISQPGVEGNLRLLIGDRKTDGEFPRRVGTLEILEDVRRHLKTP